MTDRVEDVVVTTGDVKAARVCMGGSRDWFASQGLVWQEFLDGQFTVERLEAYDDPIVNRICQGVRDRFEGGV